MMQITRSEEQNVIINTQYDDGTETKTCVLHISGTGTITLLRVESNRDYKSLLTALPASYLILTT